jgi:hypothetical protein
VIGESDGAACQSVPVLPGSDKTVASTVGPTDIVSTTHGKLIGTQAKDRAMRRRNTSVGLGPGFSGSEQLPFPIESWPEAINLGGLWGRSPHSEKLFSLPSFDHPQLPVDPVIGVANPLFRRVIVGLDIVPAGRHFGEFLPLLSRR